LKKSFWCLNLILVLLAGSLAACGGGQSAAQKDELTAPPVSGEEGAPTLEAQTQPNSLPSGVLVDPQNGSNLIVYNTGGQHEYTLNAPGIGNLMTQSAVLAGSGSDAALVYHSWDPQQALMVNKQGTISTLRTTDAFFGMASARGQAALAFSEVVVEQVSPHSYLYAGTVDNLGSASPIYDLNDENLQMALLPVAVDAQNGVPRTIWYTQSAWGIGGVDLIFPITRGLYAFNLSSDQPGQALDAERNFQGISPDMRFAASTTFDAQSDQSMTVTDLSSGQNTTYALHANNERGSGYAVFTPDSQLVAWLEAGGSFAVEPSTYHSMVRVGEIASGAVDYDIEDGSVAQALGVDQITFMKPVAWLDNQTLLIEARTTDWGQVVLVRASLGEGNLSYFSDGSFIGLAY
jgi:hypothetical protein